MNRFEENPKQFRVAIITNVVPSYRYDFYRRVVNHEDLDVTIFCQSHIPGMNLELIDKEFGKSAVRLPFWSLSREKLAWQFLPFRRLLRDFDVYFFYGNPRVLSNVIYATIFKLLGKKVVIWGQAHTWGAGKLFESIRLAWWRVFDFILVYTGKEAESIRRRGFRRQVVKEINNGLDQEAIENAISMWPVVRLNEWRKTQGLEGKTLMLSCARIEPKTRFDLFLECMTGLLIKYPELVWCVIGDGGMAEPLKDTAEKLAVGENIRWLGAIYKEEELAPWFMSSRMLIHPGAIGLSLLHAFGYGLPVITHNALEKHGPEIAAFCNLGNGLFSRFGDARSLQEAIDQLLSDDDLRHRLSASAQHTVRTEFNTRVMSERFVEMVQACMAVN